MPNRILKESIRTSKTVNAMTDFQFRLWVYLITYVDDYGRGSADAELIKGLVFPRRKRTTESDIEKALAELAGMGCINLYEIDGESYFYFPNWSEHQRIQSKKSKFPEPSTIDCNNQPYVAVIHGDIPPESNTIQSEYICPPSATDTQSSARFIKPTIDEVATYCHSRKNCIDSQKFYDFYESKGWMVGKNKMKDWKACIRTWEKNDTVQAQSFSHGEQSIGDKPVSEEDRQAILAQIEAHEKKEAN